MSYKNTTSSRASNSSVWRLRSIRTSNRDLAPNLDDLVSWKIEEICQVGGIALHEGKQRFLPTRQAFPVLAPYHRLVSDKVGYVGEIDGAAALLQLTQQAGN